MSFYEPFGRAFGGKNWNAVGIAVICLLGCFGKSGASIRRPSRSIQTSPSPIFPS